MLRIHKAHVKLQYLTTISAKVNNLAILITLCAIMTFLKPLRGFEA